MRRFAGQSACASASTAFSPPNANELLNAARTHCSRATFGTKSRSHPSPEPAGGASDLTGPVHVVGAGLLGTSVGLALTAAGMEVWLSDAAPDHVRTASALVERDFRGTVIMIARHADRTLGNDMPLHRIRFIDKPVDPDQLLAVLAESAK